MEEQFSVGDQVELKSGGDLMTVESIEGNAINCIWFDGKNKHIDKFKATTLKKSETEGSIRFEPEL
ncbi:YodC family protein [Legionella maioricensis]|uniref:DUF2158 domain-containing protein n=1 Tax=Legionella maioricensis TaxID=2896528 RepID=A0A9X2D3D7_9GAMM|nr:DUF2158 domain-containing protein [Legionella maioricensis]MCL9684897.1 DUF2158 domain-containing protein [Legionella maioricensis]MCL9688271.1 DUF2158 domain-containing protein [Legionella maioricensis]